MKKPTGDGTVFADIPGLIEGASDGVGLGHEFLRHIERTRVLLHLVDLNSEDPLVDYEIIQGELLAYGHGLADRPQIIGLNKTDSVEPELQTEIINQFREITDHPIFLISAVSREGCDRMLQELWLQLDNLKAQEEQELGHDINQRPVYQP